MSACVYSHQASPNSRLVTGYRWLARWHSLLLSERRLDTCPSPSEKLFSLLSKPTSVPKVAATSLESSSILFSAVALFIHRHLWWWTKIKEHNNSLFFIHPTIWTFLVKKKKIWQYRKHQKDFFFMARQKGLKILFLDLLSPNKAKMCCSFKANYPETKNWVQFGCSPVSFIFYVGYVLYISTHAYHNYNPKLKLQVDSIEVDFLC